MGADFCYATAEMPQVPTLENRGLYHDDDAKDAIVQRLRNLITTDREVATNLMENDYYMVLEDIASTLGRDVDWDDDDVIQSASVEVAALMEEDLRSFWNGSWERQYAWMDTYDKDGNPVRLCISGDQSWGDVPEMCSILWRFSNLPSKWWEAK